VSEKRNSKDAATRDRAATKRDVEAGIRDRMADEDMPDAEREARRYAGRDRMAAMRDRQAAARDRAHSDAESPRDD
jgi:hypothetical protein